MAASLQGQNDCYVQLDEASGFDVSPYQAELDAKACELVAAFPDSSYADSFKVYSFGFYVNLDYYDGYSYPQAFQDLQEKVAALSPYYLLIGRQSDRNGVFTKFWFDLKLPDSWLSQCFEQSYISMLRTSIIFNFRQIDYSKNPFEYAEFEKNVCFIWKI